MSEETKQINTGEKTEEQKRLDKLAADERKEQEAEEKERLWREEAKKALEEAH